jgi:hypothetical protein
VDGDALALACRVVIEPITAAIEHLGDYVLRDGRLALGRRADGAPMPSSTGGDRVMSQVARAAHRHHSTDPVAAAPFFGITAVHEHPEIDEQRTVITQTGTLEAPCECMKGERVRRSMPAERQLKASAWSGRVRRPAPAPLSFRSVSRTARDPKTSISSPMWRAQRVGTVKLGRASDLFVVRLGWRCSRATHRPDDPRTGYSHGAGLRKKRAKDGRREA